MRGCVGRTGPMQWVMVVISNIYSTLGRFSPSVNYSVYVRGRKRVKIGIYKYRLLQSKKASWRLHLTSSHYDILGIGRNCVQREIKTAFRTLAMRYHPDVTKLEKTMAEEKFKQLSQAYWILKNPQRREKYGASLPKPEEAPKPAKRKPHRPRYEGPAPWEKKSEYEWDSRALRYHKIRRSDDADYTPMREVRSPYSFLRNKVRYRHKTRAEILRDDLRSWGRGAVRSFGFWFVRRARRTNLRYRLFMDWTHKRRFHAIGRLHSKKPHKVMRAKRG